MRHALDVGHGDEDSAAKAAGAEEALGDHGVDGAEGDAERVGGFFAAVEQLDDFRFGRLLRWHYRALAV